ncbi:MAG: CoA pyrophosphatase [Pikeienuella sp.]
MSAIPDTRAAARILTRPDIERAVLIAHGRRSDYDLNPEIGEGLVRARPLRPAAVLCGLVERAGAMHVILTRRPDTLKEHAGQIAFPGGKIERTDRDPVHAALREAEEEIGIPPEAVEVVGRIDPYVTGTGFQVEPVVGFVDPGVRLRLDRREVDEAFEAPLDFLMDPANLKLQTGHWGGGERRYYAIPWRGRFIWGATAGMLKSLADRLASPEGPGL